MNMCEADLHNPQARAIRMRTVLLMASTVTAGKYAPGTAKITAITTTVA